MNISLLDLPFEIQRQILGYLYEPWHLHLERVPARSRWPLYQVSASSKLFLSPLLTCRKMHDTTMEVLNECFTKTLDARIAVQYHSLLPRAKTFLHRVETVCFSSIHTFLGSGELYQMRLPSLAVFKLDHLMCTSRKGTTAMTLFKDEDIGWLAKDTYSEKDFRNKYIERLETYIQLQTKAWQWALKSSLKLQWQDVITYGNLQELAIISFVIPFPLEDGLTLNGFSVVRQEWRPGLYVGNGLRM